jgi:RNA polymerase sigma-70 factor, ECF subfamily
VTKSNAVEIPYVFESVTELDKEGVIDELIDVYSNNVYLIAYSYVKDKGLAEDISQEVFIKCYNHLESFRGEANIKSWIYKITINTAKNMIRSKAFQVLKYPKSFFENFTRNRSSEDTFMELNESEVLVEKILLLPMKYREVIILHYFEEHRVEEIAAILQLNSNTVKTRLLRARAILKDHLKGAEWIEDEGSKGLL